MSSARCAASDATLFDLSQDGGVVKRVLREGADDGDDGDDARPPFGAKVWVHYVGALDDGTVFDSSRERDAPFSFALGRKQVIQGWDVGVATMRRGELAKFTIAPEYGYGERAVNDKIPANSTLHFEVELLRWDERDDVSKACDGSIMKRLLCEGDGREMPRVDANVKVRYAAYVVGGGYKDDAAAEPFERNDALQFTLGDCAVWLAVERCVQTMVQGEHAVFDVANQHGYFDTLGADDDGVVLAVRDTPPTDKVRLDITLVALHNAKNKRDMAPGREMLDTAAKFKVRGNALFKRGHYDAACKAFIKAMPFVEHTERWEEAAERAEAVRLCVALRLNEAACSLKTGDYSDVAKACNKVLLVEPSNLKAHYRLGQMHLARDEWDAAEQCFKRVVDLKPTEPAARRQLKRLAALRKKHLVNERQLYKGMFGAAPHAAAEPTK